MHPFNYISLTSGIFLACFLFKVSNGQLNINCYVCEAEKDSNCALRLDQIKKEPCEGLCMLATLPNGTIERNCLPLSFKQMGGGEGEFYNTPKEYEEKSWDCMKQSVGKETCRKDIIRDTFIQYPKCIQKHAEEYLNPKDPRRGKLRDFKDLPKPDFKSECVCSYDLCNANAETSSTVMSSLTNKTSSSEKSPLNNKTSSSGKSSSNANCIFSSSLWLVSVSQVFKLIVNHF